MPSQVNPTEESVVIIRPGLAFSNTCFQVGRRHFPLKELSSVQTKQAGQDPLTRNSIMLVLGGAVLVTGFARLMRPAGIVAAITVLFGLALVALMSARRRPRRLELWANYRGQPAKLFVSDDWWLFGGVERQLRRAITDARMGTGPEINQAYEPNVPHPSTMHPSVMHPSAVYAPHHPHPESSDWHPPRSTWEPAA